MRDGYGFVQCVAFQRDLDPELFEAIVRVPQESSVRISGVVRADKRAPGIPGGYEIGITGLEIVQSVEGEYPIALKEHGVDFLLDHRHLWIRVPSQWAILRVRATVIKAIRDWLDGNGFTLVDTPILTPAACEGTTTLFGTKYFDEGMAYLAQSGQLYNEADIFAFGKVYCFGPTFRAEKSKTRRHLTEFWMVEPEMAFCDLDQLMEMEEEFISHIVQTVLRDCRAELLSLGRDLTVLEKVVPPFPRISYDDAVKKLAEIRDRTDDPEQKALLTMEWGGDFGSPHETELTKLYDKPVFCYGYPSAVKAFYMEPWPGRPEVSKSVDLLAPEGYGEITGAASASLTRTCFWSASGSTIYRRMRSAGTSTCVATAACHTVVSGLVSSARLPGSVASTTSARRSPTPGPSTEFIRSWTNDETFHCRRLKRSDALAF